MIFFYLYVCVFFFFSWHDRKIRNYRVEWEARKKKGECDDKRLNNIRRDQIKWRENKRRITVELYI